MSYGYFISYAHKDDVDENLNVVNEIVKTIKNGGGEEEKEGIKVWVDKKDLIPGTEFVESIEDAIEQCTFFVFLVSENSINSEFCQNIELLKAKKADKVILPIWLMDFNEEIAKELGIEWKHAIVFNKDNLGEFKDNIKKTYDYYFLEDMLEQMEVGSQNVDVDFVGKLGNTLLDLSHANKSTENLLELPVIKLFRLAFSLDAFVEGYRGTYVLASLYYAYAYEMILYSASNCSWADIETEMLYFKKSLQEHPFNFHQTISIVVKNYLCAEFDEEDDYRLKARIKAGNRRLDTLCAADMLLYSEKYLKDYYYMCYKKSPQYAERQFFVLRCLFVKGYEKVLDNFKGVRVSRKENQLLNEINFRLKLLYTDKAIQELMMQSSGIKE